jgi:plastocyanin
MFKSKSMTTFSLGLFGMVALIAVVGMINIPGSGQYQVSSNNRTDTTTLSNGYIAGMGSSIAGIKTNNTNTNVMNVSIVANAADLEDKAYQPNPINIDVGTTIVWTNNDLTTHTVTEHTSSAVPNGFDSGLLGSEEKYRHVFDKTATIEYHCMLHPTMSGKIIVS